MSNGTAVLVTGASGFVGRALCSELAARGYVVHAVVRALESVLVKDGSTGEAENIHWVITSDLHSDTNWHEPLLAFIQDHPDWPHVIIHCAARAHVMNESAAEAASAYNEMNVGITRRLATQAAAHGVRRLIFLSSIKVNGERTAPGAPFDHQSPAKPEDPYGLSKWEAEQALWQIAASTSMEVVVVRPPLVYGPEVKGNLLRLMGLLSKKVPLPVGLIDNRRSMVGLDNLIDLLIRCLQHEAASGQTFLVSDGHDLSTPDLLRMLARVMNQRPQIFPVPVWLLRLLARLTGKTAEIDRLTESLQVNSSHARRVLGWKPLLTVEAGIKKMVDWYLTRP